ncbi:GntR family transcriptional regulator [Arvimicrobium flavum]|uniref:GntR family transcriptional regulator n=1 Tax=Arvimicrobium flavum TaxID=3393320 RepID=UPI00237C2146|nr:GntR family transcriptional regulator [Mesorhizobium shangrilense]
MTETSDPNPQGQIAYARLIDEIRRGSLPPGSRLRETELAERFEISRTPIREALRMLEADGLVVHQPRLGAVVRSLDYAEVIELYEMRAVLEGTAARLAARTASDVELADLQALNEEFGQVLHDPSQSAEVNRQFHAALMNAARNRFLSKSVAGLAKTMFILGRSTLMEAERAEVAYAEHAHVLAALAARDGVAAEAAMRAHIEAAQRSRLKVLRLQEREAEARLEISDGE